MLQHFALKFFARLCFITPICSPCSLSTYRYLISYLNVVLDELEVLYLSEVKVFEKNIAVLKLGMDISGLQH